MYSLAPLHTFGLCSSTRRLITIESINELQSLLDDYDPDTFYILGEGSNTVFLEDYAGTVIKPAFMGINLEHSATHYLLKVGASENWHQLVIWCMQNKIYGLENLALIPGTVGAAPIQNIGAYGLEIAEFIEHVYYYDLVNKAHNSLDLKACEFAYRDSVFKNRLEGKAIITGVTFAIPKDWQAVLHYGDLKGLLKPSAIDIFNKVVNMRMDKLPDPSKIGNAGSFFKNPVINLNHYIKLQQNWPCIPSYRVDTDKVKVPAAWLIEQLGFKGIKIGGIGCHPKQALVLTNDGSGTGVELLELARSIKDSVLNEFEIVLVNEVRLIGKHGTINL